MLKLTELTPDQIACIPSHLRKWRQLATSTDRLDPDRAIQAARNYCIAFGWNYEDIRVCESPLAAVRLFQQSMHPRSLELLNRAKANSMERSHRTHKRCIERVEQLVRMADEIDKDVVNSLFDIAEAALVDRIQRTVYLGIAETLADFDGWVNLIDMDIISSRPAFDFFHTILELRFEGREDKETSIAFRGLANLSDWVLHNGTTCLICERPVQLALDSNQRPHAEGAAAIHFADGFAAYAYQGIPLPETYGQITPDRWVSNWVLLEKRDDVRVALASGIGWNRLTQELTATAIETSDANEIWQLRDRDRPESTPIYLLKSYDWESGTVYAIDASHSLDKVRQQAGWVEYHVRARDVPAMSEKVLSSELEEALSRVAARWRRIALSTRRIEREKIAKGIRAAYRWCGCAEPKVRFFDSSYAACQYRPWEATLQLGHHISENLWNGTLEAEGTWQGGLHHQLYREFEASYVAHIFQLRDRLAWWQDLMLTVDWGCYRSLQVTDPHLESRLTATSELRDFHHLWYLNVVAIDYCTSILHFEANKYALSFLKALSMLCGRIFDYEDECLVCERPVQILLDKRKRVHAEGEPAIVFADGFGIYAKHGKLLTASKN